MMLKDIYGEITSSANRRCLDLYQIALRELQCYRGNPVATIDEALSEDRDFVLGHVLRAYAHIGAWENSVLPEVCKSVGRLNDLEWKANSREKLHTSAIRSWVSGDWNGMRLFLDQINSEWPRDMLALQFGHLTDFYQGDRENLRNRIARTLPSMNADDPGYGFLLGMHAFGLEECGDYTAAEESARRAIMYEPEDCWAQHAIAHVMEMQARQVEGIAWMESRTQHWAQKDNSFAFHNWWHTALYHLDQDNAPRALEIYDTGVRPEAIDVQLEMVDAAALLWRMHLNGIDVGARWEELASTYEKTSTYGFYVFNDMHTMMAYVGAGREREAAKLVAAVKQQIDVSGSNAIMSKEVGLPIVCAIEAFGRGDYDEVVNMLLPVRGRAYILGGSHAQRDVVNRTLLEASLRGRDSKLAVMLTRERTSLKPHCPFSWRLRQRAETSQVSH